MKSGIELAKLHSKAVDYIKSGQPATMHKSLNPKAFPHFMERGRKSYTSAKPLGRIYTRVNVEKFNPAYNMAFDDRILSRFQLSKEEVEKAREVKAKYDVAMRRLMGQHERPISEFEIWSTFILSKPRVGNDYKLAETVGREVSALKNRFRAVCGEAVTGVAQKSEFFSYSSIDLEKLDRFVAAMYTVTNDEVQEALRARALPVLDEDGIRIADDQGANFPMPLISFPWLFHKELARVASGVKPVTRMWKNFGAANGDGDSSEATQNNAPMGSAKTVSQAAEVKAEVKVEMDMWRIEEKGGDEEKKKKVVVKNEGAAAAEYELGDADAVCVPTASGKIFKRGEILDLFEDTSQRAEVLGRGVPGQAATPSLAAVPDDEGGREHADETSRPFGFEGEGDVGEDDEEDDDDDDEDDDEHPLEELARVIAGK